MAVAQEAPELATQENVYITGLGKVNAAITAARLIQQHRPDTVINFGTAGGITVGPGLHQVTKFVQRDMLCTPLGVEEGVTPFEENSKVISFGEFGLTCSTGDDFVTSGNLSIPADLVDMESYAIAKACRAAGVDFVCYKYVSDMADEKADQDWKENHHQGQSLYLAKLQKITLPPGESDAGSILS